MKNQYVVSEIKLLSKQIADSDIEQLRIEEEILYMLVKSQKHSLSIKTEAFKRITEINEMQNNLLGSVLKSKFPIKMED